jgi:hypothetical protein
VSARAILSPRSTWLISVRCSDALTLNSSCERPARFRQRARLSPRTPLKSLTPLPRLMRHLRQAPRNE